MASYLYNYLAGQNTTPQTSPLPNSTQKQNNAGGYSWEVDDLTRLRRFICLGSEKGSYYVNEKELTAQNIESLSRLLQAGRGAEVVSELLDFSLKGRTAKQDPILLALALCVRQAPDAEVKRLALEAVGKICRIPTFLFSFVTFVEALDPNSSGWGRGMRKAVSEWYLSKEPQELAFAVTKYRQRGGWSHRDLLRLCHAKPRDEGHRLVFAYVTKGKEALGPFEAEHQRIEEEFDFSDHPPPGQDGFRAALALFRALEEVSGLGNEVSDEGVARLCQLISRLRLAREHLPSQYLNSVPVWEELLRHMPMTAMLRNLAKMTSIGLLSEAGPWAGIVSERLGDPALLKKARIHPYNVLVALKVYSQGRGEKGSLTWAPVPSIVKALDGAFYKSFHNVEPTGQRVLIGLDVSGSMGCNILGSDSITCREGAMAMSMVMAKTEPACVMTAFTTGLVPLEGVSPNKTLEQNLKATSNLPFGGTDCSQPMVYASSRNLKIDTFIVYTDNETYAGKMHPSKALEEYRRKMKLPHAKLIVVGMSVGQFTIADPNDRGMLDIAGFDSNAPEVMRNFMTGLI